MTDSTAPDGRSYPKAPLLGVSAAVFRDGAVLLARRAVPPARGLWSLPGGLVETGEALREAAARELMEEAGVEAEMLEPADVIEVIRRDDNGRPERHYVIIAFAGAWRAGEAEPREATDAVRWVVPDAIRDLPLTDGAETAVRRAAAIVARHAKG